jgi:membrane protease YdiL (CAAX protease family)
VISAAARTDDPLATRLRGFGPIGIAAFLVIIAGNLLFVPLSAMLVFAWAWRSRTPWHEIGYVRSRSWPRTIAIAASLGAAFKLLMKAVVMPLLGAPAINAAYHHLAGNTAALPGMILAVTLGAGVGEETVFRGYLFERLGKLLGPGTPARVAIVVLMTTWFGLGHYHDQGVPGAEQALVTGAVFGSFFAVTGRIWPLIFAHAAFDLAAVAIIYFDVESAVAHAFFR